MNTKNKGKKACEQCGGEKFKSRMMTYPLNIDNRQINIGQVAVRECLDCHATFPTKAGQEKISRCLTMMSQLDFFGP